MIPFDFQPQTRIVFGADRVDELGALAAELGGRRALVVSDRGVVAAGHTQRGLDALARAGLVTHLFSDVVENPSTLVVDAAVAVARDFRPDVIVGLGGGSSMDAAKGCNFIHSNGGRMQDYWGKDKAKKPMLPMIAVPTTAGTGSEAQSFALISDAETHVKMACGDKKAACKIALLDPTLTVSQPPRVTALTGLDALVHAAETWVCRVRTGLSALFAREAWRQLHANFHRVLAEPTNLEARGGMLLGACWAGWAIENSMLGAAHAAANPLTAAFDVVHGQAVALLVPHVIRFNAAACGGLYRELTAGAAAGVIPADSGAEGLAAFLTEATSRAGLATRLRDLPAKIPQDALPGLAAAAMKQWTAGFNPRPLDEASFLALYQAAY